MMKPPPRAALLLALLAACSHADQPPPDTQQQALRQLAAASYAAPGATRQECLGRYVFSVRDQLIWPLHASNGLVFKVGDGPPGHDYADYAIPDGEGTDTTLQDNVITELWLARIKLEVIHDPGKAAFLSAVNHVEGDKRRIVKYMTQAIAELTAEQTSNTDPTLVNYYQRELDNARRRLATADTDYSFPLDTPDSLGYQNAAYVYRQPYLYKFTYGRSWDDLTPEERGWQIDGLRDMARRLQPRAPYQIPTTPGICVPYGLIADNGELAYTATADLRYADAPGVVYRIDTGVLPKGDGGDDGNTPLTDSLRMATLSPSDTRDPGAYQPLQHIGPRSAMLGPRPASQGGTVGALTPWRYWDSKNYLDGSPHSKRVVAQRKARGTFEVYRLYTGTGGVPGSQALPWLSVELKTLHQDQVPHENNDETEPRRALKVDPSPFAHSLPRLEEILRSIRLRPTWPALPEIQALQQGYGEGQPPAGFYGGQPPAQQ
ncbi:hypothetical protein ACFOKJ_00660 [Vogesella amnigena]|uniref:Tle cognate immunity protein 4 C-terminal domain-containing protein n=1 Tax=Vogesella amnigena TaxID=1507449 RepID=A0ABV7TMU6_9NEIS